MIEHDAVKYYWIHLNAKHLSGIRVHWNDSYIPIFKSVELIHLHTFSIVTYCHRNAPEQFHALNRHGMCKVFPESRTLSGNGSSHSYRILTQQQFEEIVK